MSPKRAIGEMVWCYAHGKVKQETIVEIVRIYDDFVGYRLSNQQGFTECGVFGSKDEAIRHGISINSELRKDAAADVRDAALDLAKLKRKKQSYHRIVRNLKRALDKESQCNR